MREINEIFLEGILHKEPHRTTLRCTTYYDMEHHIAGSSPKEPSELQLAVVWPWNSFEEVDSKPPFKELINDELRPLTDQCICYWWNLPDDGELLIKDVLKSPGGMEGRLWFTDKPPSLKVRLATAVARPLLNAVRKYREPEDFIKYSIRELIVKAKKYLPNPSYQEIVAGCMAMVSLMDDMDLVKLKQSLGKVFPYHIPRDSPDYDPVRVFVSDNRALFDKWEAKIEKVGLDGQLWYYELRESFLQEERELPTNESWLEEKRAIKD